MEKITKHPNVVVGYDGTIPQLARAIGCLPYDQVASFIGSLSVDLRRQALADSDRGRKELSGFLSDTVYDLDQSRECLVLVWKSCGLRASDYPFKLDGYDGQFYQLAQAVGNMAYNQVVWFIEKLFESLKERAADSPPSITGNLYDAILNLDRAREDMGSAWKKCKPHMPKSY